MIPIHSHSFSFTVFGYNSLALVLPKVSAYEHKRDDDECTDGPYEIDMITTRSAS